MSAARGHALFQARLIHVGHRRQVGIRLVFEIANVLAADQAVADEAHLHAIVCAQRCECRKPR